MGMRVTGTRRTPVDTPHVEKVYNLYGLTEDSCFSIGALVDPARKPLIGKPITNREVYLFDTYLQPLPVGVPGELFIGGAGLARGYLSRPALTAERFIPNPHASVKGDRLYKTGDLAQWQADGQVAYLGRLDNQTKVRGFRIELGEVEAHLHQHPAVEEAVVMARLTPTGDKWLVAYLTPRPGQKLDGEQIRQTIRKQLPGYMVPAVFVAMETLPRTPNGKIDRKSLPEVRQQKSFVPPKDEREKALASIWREVLGRKEISAMDHFFELGGNSLSATRVVARVQRELGIGMALRDIFAYPTIRSLARGLASRQAEPLPPIATLPRASDYACSHAQKRFWVQDQFEQAGKGAPVSYMIRGALNPDSFRAAWKSLLERHEILRTLFFIKDGEPRQRIIPAPEAKPFFKIRDLSRSDDVDAAIKTLEREEAETAMDLEKGPLARIHLLKLAADRFLCLCSVHHIISDGWSTTVLLNDLKTLYDAHENGRENPLRPLPFQYKDYAAWHNRLLAGEPARAMRRYWLNHLGPKPPRLRLATDFPRIEGSGFRRETHRFQVSASDLDNLDALTRAHGATLFIGVLAALKLLLHRNSAQEDIIVGAPIAGRVRDELENQIGPYLNILALRDQIQGEDSFLQVLERVRQTTLDAYAHQAYPFDLVVEDLKLKRDMARNPLFDVGLTLQNQSSAQKEVESRYLDVWEKGGEDPETRHTEARTDFWFLGRVADGRLDMTLVYNGALFRAETAAKMGKELCRVVAEVTANPEIRSAAIPLGEAPAPSQREKITIDLGL